MSSDEPHQEPLALTYAAAFSDQQHQPSVMRRVWRFICSLFILGLALLMLAYVVAGVREFATRGRLWLPVASIIVLTLTGIILLLTGLLQALMAIRSLWGLPGRTAWWDNLFRWLNKPRMTGKKIDF